MKNVKTVKLLAGVFDVKIQKATDTETTIEFSCPAWKTKTCIHIVPGRWEIQSVNRNLVTLVNHDVTIPDHGKI